MDVLIYEIPKQRDYGPSKPKILLVKKQTEKVKNAKFIIIERCPEEMLNLQ